MNRRVVVTGFGGLTSLGHDWPTISRALRERRSGITRMDEWDRFEDLHTRLAGPVAPFDKPKHFTRKRTRSMGRVALMSTLASERALEDAGLLGDPVITGGRTGVAYGSSAGSMEPIRVFGRMLDTGSMMGVTSNSYIQMMPHTTAVNVELFFDITGRVIPTSSACTSSSQGIGYAYEAIKFGLQDVMLAGGAEELTGIEAAVFDAMFATSTRNDEPEHTPRPFDQERDGLVVGEGATTLILEDYERARERGATIYAEVVGFGCNSDGNHVTQPQASTMAEAMRLSLADADLAPEQIGYVGAHGTATDLGDVAETRATEEILGRGKPISSLKSYVGHTLGACGSLEAWWTIQMMRENWFAPTINLENLDADCGDLDYITGDGREIETDYVMSNNFAFGGINTSLIFRRWRD